jgi:PPE-repeat protein
MPKYILKYYYHFFNIKFTNVQIKVSQTLTFSEVGFEFLELVQGEYNDSQKQGTRDLYLTF